MKTRTALIAAGLLAALALPVRADLTVVQVAPFSGQSADAGTLLNEGASLAFRDVNDKGGIHGQKIRFVKRDDGYKAEETVRQVKEAAATDKPVAFLGLVGTANFVALLQNKVLDEVGVPVVGVRTGASAVRRPGSPLAFHLRASYVAEVDKLVEVASSIGAKKFGALYQDDAFGQDGLDALKKSLAARGLTLVATGSYEKNTTKVEPAVEALTKATNVDAVILVSNTQATAAFVKAYREKGGLAQLYTLSVNSDREVVSRAGADKAHGLGIAQVVPFPTSGALPITREYQALLHKYQPEAQPSVFSMEGFIYGKVLVEALRRAGPNPDRAALVKALESSPFELGGFVLKFSPTDHEGSKFVELTMINKAGTLIR